MADSTSASPATTATTPPPGSGDTDRVNKLQSQLRKLTDANGKYKNLLKLAKERIQQQEKELESNRHDKSVLEERLEELEEAQKQAEKAFESDSAGERTAANADEVHNIIQVCQRVKIAPHGHINSSGSSNGQEEIWALLEMEVVPINEAMDAVISNTKRYKEWKRFDTESELQDFIRRDTGEPLTLPPFSLSPDQSARIQDDAESQVSRVTEDFRRFRVRSELARKQADAQIRDLQSNKFRSATRRIEGQDMQFQLEQARSVTGELERVKAELAAQEAHWKEAYDVLLAENNALKSSGSEALLASQWRQRYETCKQEKEALEERIQAASSKADQNGGDTYEAKYRDLKESFRLYRKKAKEIFEAQERGVSMSSSIGVPPMSALVSAPLSITDASSAEAKISYLRNLMVNYFTAEQAVRDHMETAIGTVLQFSPEEVERIDKKKAANDAWF